MTGLFTKDAREILEAEGQGLYTALLEAHRLRERRHGRSVNLCWIANARSGHCDQDCAFCAQSIRSSAGIDAYPLLAPSRLVDAAKRAAAAGAVRFSIVTSGREVEEGRDLGTILFTVDRIRQETALDVCVSLGCVSRAVLDRLRAAGVTRYHHNLECAESFWPEVCTTRPYEESRRVIRDARAAGLEVCSGGVFGMGESLDQRIELLDEARRLEVDSVALNFFVPIEGTPFERVAPIDPMACIRVIVAARLMMPRCDIRICGGRERNLRDLQALALIAGAAAGRGPVDAARSGHDPGHDPRRPHHRDG